MAVTFRFIAVVACARRSKSSFRVHHHSLHTHTLNILIYLYILYLHGVTSVISNLFFFFFGLSISSLFFTVFKTLLFVNNYYYKIRDFNILLFFKEINFSRFFVSSAVHTLRSPVHNERRMFGKLRFAIESACITSRV